MIYLVGTPDVGAKRRPTLMAAVFETAKASWSRCERDSALMSVVNALGARNRPPKRTAVHDDDRVWVEAELKDVGDQALM
ncbi:hypothetical protein, partial [Rhizobium leguminosarum]|uniref:hypothetical protein n=1 Tax=Rhizobium leguminosarum TaxID=384 RepID=UPI001C98E186